MRKILLTLVLVVLVWPVSVGAQMMGGEGSESLRQAHIKMGSNYLGCVANGKLGLMKGGGGKMFGMMGGSYLGVHYFLGVVTWVLVTVLLVAAIRYLWRKGGGKR